MLNFSYTINYLLFEYYDSYILNILLLRLNFLFLVSTVVAGTIIAYFIEFSPFRNFFKIPGYSNILRILLVAGLGISFLMFIVNIWLFIDVMQNLTNSFVTESHYIYTQRILDTIPVFSSINCSIDFFGIILLFLAYAVGFISLLTLDTRLYWRNFRYIFIFNLFLLIVYLYVITQNLLLLFLFYEFLLLPSFLFIYFVSSSRRAIQASLYFVIWTQLGSFLVLLAISYIIFVVGSSEFSVIKRFNFSLLETYWLYTLLFLGFGFKVPIWPFHYWLTKTHVEAPSGFSIYLSGFLVKSALYGFYKITILLNTEINTSIFILVTLLGVLDASLKMWGQTDIKKLVAYGTIQEMNLIFLVFCWGDASIILAGIIFTVTHAFLSALMFFLVDCIYRRFHSRSIIEVNGILHITPNLSTAVLAMVIFFAGLPGTIKFISEFFIFSSFLEISPSLCVILMFVANVIGLVGFSKNWFNLVFGSFTKYTKYVPMDLSLKELYLICINFIFLFMLSYLPIILF